MTLAARPFEDMDSWRYRRSECNKFQHVYVSPHGLLEDLRRKSLGDFSSEVTWLLPPCHWCNDTHRACSWVIDFHFTVSSLLSSEEGLNLSDMVRAHK